MEQKITANFSYFEFRPRNTPTTWAPDNDLQALMIRTLAENLQIIRSMMPAKASIKITSAVRTQKDAEDLIRSGYNPSPTSDHFCGFSVPIQKTDSKYQKFGPTYNFACGAADCVPMGMKVSDFFSLAVNETKNGRCRFGQVIHEYTPSTGAEWVHFGNDPTSFFSMNICSLIARSKFMKSIDGGKTYQVVVV